MNDFIEVTSYSIKESRTGNKIPVINDVHIHSAYDPIKEAISIIQQHQKSILNNKNVLVLGLGFGYHINEIVSVYKENNINDYTISIIEPNDQVVKDCLSINPISSENIKIYSDKSIAKLYQNDDLVEVLLQKPVIIPHTSSFNLYKSYFRKYLTYKAPTSIEESKDNIKDQDLYHYICTLNQEISLNEAYKSILKSSCLNNPLDYALLAFGKISEQVKVIN